MITKIDSFEDLPCLFSKSQADLIEKYDLDPSTLDYARPSNNIKSVAKSKKDGKWYGWSHRAIYGFKAGDIIDKGSCLDGFKGANGRVYGIGDKCKSEEEAKQWAKDFAHSVG